MKTINTIADLQQLVLAGVSDWKQFGRVNVRENGNLLLFNYTQEAQFGGDWNAFEIMSRGLIINRETGEIVARPFDKFWNWLEGGRKAHGHIVTVIEKLDGSLGIFYRDSGEYKIATRGSFNSEQAIWATNFLREHYNPAVPDELTLLFEIIYHENRVVVDYGDRQDLFLLAARNRFTGEYLPFFPDVVELAEYNALPLPKVYQFNNIDSILEMTGVIGPDQEGWVVEFSDNSRWKIKGDQYRELHRLITGLSFKWVLEAVVSGNIQSAFETLPDEFLGQAKQWYAEIQDHFDQVKEGCEQAFSCAPAGATRKEFALWVMENYKPLSSYLFAMLDGRPIDLMIYQTAFKDVKETN